MSTRQHGTRAKYVHEGCDCLLCRVANADYAAANSRARQQGRVDLVDASPVREHLRALAGAGVGSRRVVERSGVARSALRKIATGETLRVRSGTASAMLAVGTDRAAGCVVDGTGTRRRLRALVAVGWSQQRLAAELGWTPSNFARLIGDDAADVAVRTAITVRDTYDRLWNTEPPCATPAELGGRNRARRHAAERGWALPLAWDDDQIDDPAAVPDPGSPDRARGVDLDEVAFLASTGAHITEIARRLGCSVAAIEKARERAKTAEAVSA